MIDEELIRLRNENERLLARLTNECVSRDAESVSRHALIAHRDQLQQELDAARRGLELHREISANRQNEIDAERMEIAAIKRERNDWIDWKQRCAKLEDTVSAIENIVEPAERGDGVVLVAAVRRLQTELSLIADALGTQGAGHHRGYGLAEFAKSVVGRFRAQLDAGAGINHERIADRVRVATEELESAVSKIHTAKIQLRNWSDK